MKTKTMTKAEMEARIADLEYALRALISQVADQSAKLGPIRARDVDVSLAFCLLQGTAAYCEGKLR